MQIAVNRIVPVIGCLDRGIGRMWECAMQIIDRRLAHHAVSGFGGANKIRRSGMHRRRVRKVESWILLAAKVCAGRLSCAEPQWLLRS
jgi:hypothetical protein